MPRQESCAGEGRLAQMVERSLSMREVEGSIPSSSINCFFPLLREVCYYVLLSFSVFLAVPFLYVIIIMQIEIEVANEMATGYRLS